MEGDNNFSKSIKSPSSYITQPMSTYVSIQRPRLNSLTPKSNTNSRDVILNKFDLASFYKITQRTFAPWEKFGKILPIQTEFEGDDRGFSLMDHVSRSTSRASNLVTSRICQQVYFTPWKVYDHFATASDTEGPQNFIWPKTIDFGKPSSTARIRFNKDLYIQFEGSNPLVSIAPDIDWMSSMSLKIINKASKKYLQIYGRTKGKGFPAFEAFITDKNDTNVFIKTISSPPKLHIFELLHPVYDVFEQFYLQIELLNDFGLFGENIYSGIKVKQHFTDGSIEHNWQLKKATIEEWNTTHLKKAAFQK